jgi:hypothetical protein
MGPVNRVASFSMEICPAFCFMRQQAISQLAFESRQRAEVIQNYENVNVRGIEKVNPDTGNARGLNLSAVKRTTVQVTRQPL